MLTVLKRDNKKEVPYDMGKVRKAISNAFADTDNTMPNWIVEKVDEAIKNTGKEKITVTGGSYSFNPTDYVPSGYTVSEVDGKYVVSAQ